ncbi:5-carboxymethyl-2-hydroxymuconate Delta-isomerase [Cupriavidus taiwanensis]|uniref:5-CARBOXYMETHYL-2-HYDROXYMUCONATE DELTA-ISOMERASE PROTEIN n=1 Tax=Cupriavidus taiwanensis (strain DSM 17343 / BCRC 17206 / CCUG 44338 / CIP 107171 / LMG 19424 / R1) TaxID=977880 RepID=B3R0X3_CUPTR|nr:5-carboxymethyl-2-hydroxymuconate Delta-isomerase [Cupriavidus taiwanensis]CAQ68554.1 5-CARBOXYMETHYL-2-HYDROXYMUCONATE DELTA-ISOMERASE PROTEIN [Cupriavidus taiwanensis LMG 19424]
MPHLTVEYTRNLAPVARIDALLAGLSAVLLAQPGAFAPGGIRARAVCLESYRMADGSGDDAFVHVTLAVAAGRPQDVLDRTVTAMFDCLTAHFAEPYRRRYLALSLELREFAGAYRSLNNIHQRYSTTAA